MAYSRSGREYAPLGPNLFSPMPIDESDYFGDTSQEPNELQNDPQQPGDIPLMKGASRQLQSPDSSYDSARYQSLSPDTGDRRDSSRTWSQQSTSTLRRKPVHSSSSHQSLRKSLISPSLHKNVSDPTRPYARYYSFRRTRDKLFVRGFQQLAVTVFFSGAVAAVLAGYQRISTIGPDQKHIFNALITGLSICLGMNLAASLKSYAELLRWRLLTWSWLSLKEFDLVLQCGSLRKVCALFLESRRRTFPFLSLIQFICASWVAFNVAAQILVAMIGLTYSLDTASGHIYGPGNVSIANLSIIKDLYGSGGGALGGQLSSAHGYGIQGQDFGLYSVSDPLTASEHSYEQLYTTPDFSYVLYRFQDYVLAPSNSIITNAPSVRTINTTATCFSYPVINLTNAYLDSQEIQGIVAYYNDGNSANDQLLYVPEFAYGAVTWLSYFNEFPCGPRCNSVWGLQAKLLPDIGQSTIYWCNSTVGHVSNLTPQGELVSLHDTQARYLAGAIGWTGYFAPLGNGTEGYQDFQYLLYSNDSYWSPSYVLDANGEFSAARFVSQFSAAALAAIDQNGPSATITDSPQPQIALMVTVQWRFTIPLLVSIVVAQMVALLVVILWANKAVIVDESFLSIAKLLAPTVAKLGLQGSVLQGEEIADAITEKLGGEYKVFYGCREVRDEEADNQDGESGGSGMVYGSHWTGPILRADIIDKGFGILPKKDRPFSDGTYD